MDKPAKGPSTGFLQSLRGLPANVWVVTATSFLTDVSSEMIFNLVPLFLANVLNAGTAVIGLIDGLAETTASLMKIYAGGLSDRLGQRKWLTVLGYGISTVSKPFLYIANTWGWVLGVRVADRFGKGVRTAPRDALVADSIDEKQRGLAFGMHRAGDTAGAFLGRGPDRLADRARRGRPDPPHFPDPSPGQHHPGDTGGAGTGPLGQGDRRPQPVQSAGPEPERDGRAL
jgi:hypothetical protein